MFGTGVKASNRGPAHTLISRSTEIVGDVHFSGELIVEGKIVGNVIALDDTDALVRIADKGVVEGEVRVPSIVVNGLVQGDVRSTRHIELAAKAVVVGNVFYNLIEMVMGSEVNGNLMHVRDEHKDAKLLGFDEVKIASSNPISKEK